MSRNTLEQYLFS